MLASVDSAQRFLVMHILEGFDGYLPSFPEHMHIPSGSLVSRICRRQRALIGQDFSKLPHSILGVIIVDEIEEVVVGYDLFPCVIVVMSDENLVLSVGIPFLAEMSLVGIHSLNDLGAKSLTVWLDGINTVRPISSSAGSC